MARSAAMPNRPRISIPIPFLVSPVIRRVAWHVRRVGSEIDRRFFLTLAQANVTQGVAWGLYVSGAVALGTGALLFSLNVPQPYLVDPESGSTVAVAPMLMLGSRGVMVSLSF